ncbi:MAG TPA: hypothetical protein VGL72_03160 [Bryobacteraceae bacterium]|jgi:hypothetical protein
MRRPSFSIVLCAIAILFANHLLSQATAPAQAPKKAAPAAPKAAAGPAAMTNRDVIRLLQAKISEDIIITKIKQSKTRFDTSVDGLVALRTAGASDRLMALVMDPSAEPPAAAANAAAPAAKILPAPVEPAEPAAPKYTGPASNREHDAAPSVSATAVKSEAPRPIMISAAPENYGVYVVSQGKLQPLGRIQTKVQVSKFRSLIKGYVPFVRSKIDIDIPGAHSTSRFEQVRPTFYAYFPPSRDVSKFKLLQCKITGQKFDQRTVANASIMFSTEQNQDEVPIDIGPAGSTKDLYRIFPREDIPAGEFAFVEGNSGSKSTSNIEIIDVYDFGIDRKEERMPLKEYLDTHPGPSVSDTSFLTWNKDDCQKIVSDRDGHTGITGSLMGWFKRQYASLDVYWADEQFAKAFARLEMLDRDLTPQEAARLAGTLTSPDHSKFYVVVSVGGKIGSGRLIGANEGERIMRPFDATLSNDKGKDIVPAKRLEFMGGYAGMWKVEFDQTSIRGPLLQDSATKELVFEARLNQNLDFKAKFEMDRIGK